MLVSVVMLFEGAGVFGKIVCARLRVSFAGKLNCMPAWEGLKTSSWRSVRGSTTLQHVDENKAIVVGLEASRRGVNNREALLPRHKANKESFRLEMILRHPVRD